MGDEDEELEEAGERLAHREGRRRFAGRAGLEKFLWTEEEETEDSLLSCGETNELPFRIITPFPRLSNSATQILYILSRVPSVVFLTLGKTIGIFQTTNTGINSALSAESYREYLEIPVLLVKKRKKHLSRNTFVMQ